MQHNGEKIPATADQPCLAACTHMQPESELIHKQNKVFTLFAFHTMLRRFLLLQISLVWLQAYAFVYCSSRHRHMHLYSSQKVTASPDTVNFLALFEVSGCMRVHLYTALLRR